MLEFLELTDSLQRFIQPWRRLTIGIDGRTAVGKSPLARYLAWVLRNPAIETDLFIIGSGTPIQHRYDDLRKIIEVRHSLDRPVIVEGICLLRTLEKLNVTPDYLVFVDSMPRKNDDPDLEEEWRTTTDYDVENYISQCRPQDRCQFLMHAAANCS